MSEAYCFPAIKGLRPPEHHAGESHPDHKKNFSDSNNITKCYSKSSDDKRIVLRLVVMIVIVGMLVMMIVIVIVIVITVMIMVIVNRLQAQHRLPHRDALSQQRDLFAGLE